MRTRRQSPLSAERAGAGREGKVAELIPKNPSPADRGAERAARSGRAVEPAEQGARGPPSAAASRARPHAQAQLAVAAGQPRAGLVCETRGPSGSDSDI